MCDSDYHYWVNRVLPIDIAQKNDAGLNALYVASSRDPKRSKKNRAKC
ncbi:MAG TPA: hypothetical protein VEL11_17275 [Candidatus Bathyarchaeia archaeon]|nr:hypothetical protein [Candidatus Bathyarchaeia archaeon]